MTQRLIGHSTELDPEKTYAIIEELSASSERPVSALLLFPHYITNLPSQTDWSELYQDLKRIAPDNASLPVAQNISARWARDDIHSSIEWLIQEHQANGTQKPDWHIQTVLSSVPAQQALEWLQNTAKATMRERVVQSYVDTQLTRAFSLNGEASSDAIVALEALNRSAVTNPHFNHDIVTEDSFLTRIGGSENLQALIDAQIFSERIDTMLAEKLAER